VSVLGRPRLHLRETGSTNDRARALAGAGAPHGTLVTAAEQTAGRGRQGRAWSAPPGRALLLSLVLRDPAYLLPLAAAVAVADVAGPAAQIKWPNDVLLDGGKVAGILAESRPQEGWAVLGIGLNVAVALDDLPAGVRAGAATMGLAPRDVEPVLDRLLAALEGTLELAPADVLAAWRARDALRGEEVAWAQGRGRAAGIDGDGRLVVDLAGGGRTTLDAGEVHLAGRVAQGSRVVGSGHDAAATEEER
jgi:BirA family transcriptional regulator, biotin operon repressor / biotin---[acetyl-CoA-carboxylase] ligase